jgi:hypothetical protein
MIDGGLEAEALGVLWKDTTASIYCESTYSIVLQRIVTDYQGLFSRVPNIPTVSKFELVLAFFSSHF